MADGGWTVMFTVAEGNKIIPAPPFVFCHIRTTLEANYSPCGNLVAGTNILGDLRAHSSGTNTNILTRNLSPSTRETVVFLRIRILFDQDYDNSHPLHHLPTCAPPISASAAF